MNYAQSRCLVIGGCGFLGSYVAESLIEAGYLVRIFDRVHVDTANIANIINKVEMLYGDLSNNADIESALEGVDYVFNFAGATDPRRASEDPIFDVEANVIGTLNLLIAMVKLNCQKLVFSSSGGTVYGLPLELPITEEHTTTPISAYGVSKLAIEKYIQLYHYLHGIDYVILRIANPYGPHQNLHNAQGAIVHFLNSIKQGKIIQIWGDGSVVRDYFYAQDLKTLIPLLLESDIKNTIYNIGKGVGYSLKDILLTIQDVLGSEIEVEYLPGRPIDVNVNYLAVDRICTQTGWKATTSLYDGIEETWRWITDSAKFNG